MRALIDGKFLEQTPRGIARATVALYAACAELDPSLEICVLHRQNLRANLPDRIDSWHCLPNLPDRLWRGTVIPSMTWLRRASFVHFPANGEIPALLPAGRVILTLHDILPLEIPGFFRSEKAQAEYEKRLKSDIERADLIITDSEYSKQRITEVFHPRSEPEVVPLFCYLELDTNVAWTPPQPSGDYFLYLGGYESRKGLEELLAVFLELRNTGALTSNLVLTGKINHFSPIFADLVTYGKQAGYVEELGYVSDIALKYIIANAKALVYPSRYEGFGLPVLEAMTLGCPVACSNRTSLPEIGGDAVLYIDPDQRHNLAFVLQTLENDAALRAELRAKGIKRAQEFSANRTATRFLEVVRNRVRSGD